MSERFYTQHASGPANISGYFWLQGPQMADQIPEYVRAAFTANPDATLVLIQVKREGREAFSLYEPLPDAGT